MSKPGVGGLLQARASHEKDIQELHIVGQVRGVDRVEVLVHRQAPITAGDGVHQP